MKILVIGQHGFVSSNLIRNLNLRKIDYEYSQREDASKKNYLDLSRIDSVYAFNFNKFDIVINASGIAHRVKKKSEYKLNFLPIKALLQRCEEHNVYQYIHISTAGIYGNSSDNVIHESSPKSCSNHYIRSKYEADKIIEESLKSTICNYTIIRPPMIYGQSAPGNYTRLYKLMKLNLPLPFKSAQNLRSFIHIDNLCNFIIHIFLNKNAYGEIFLVKDHNDFTLNDLMNKIGDIEKIEYHLFSFPIKIIKILMHIMFIKKIYESIFADCRIDQSKAYNLLDWKPPIK